MISKIFGGASSVPIAAIGNVIDKLFTSDDERLDKNLLIQRLLQQPQLAQVELNKIEAQHRSLFIAGWRPAIGWVCAFGVAYCVLIQPITSGFGLNYPEIPDASYTLLLTLTLGMAGLRTGEKFGGRTK